MENLRRIREKLGYTQNDIADMVGVNEGTYRKWESGKVSPKGTDIVKLAGIFNCTTDYLLGLISEPTYQQADLKRDYGIDPDVAAVLPYHVDILNALLPLSSWGRVEEMIIAACLNSGWYHNAKLLQAAGKGTFDTDLAEANHTMAIYRIYQAITDLMQDLTKIDL